jgi:hypothetical protein
MMLGLLWMLLANAACLLGAHEIWLRCRTGQAAADGALFLLLRFALASGAVLAAGLAGALTGAALGIAGAAALGALLLAGAHRRVRLPSLRALRERVPMPLLILAGAFLVRLLLQVWVLSPHVGDAICYHLPKVAEWIQQGRITAETGVDYRSPFPGGFELFEIWWSVFLHHDLLIEAAGVETWLMAFAAVLALARWAGLPHAAAFLAALLFGAIPVMLMQAVGTLNDLPVAAIFLAGTALVVARAHPAILLLAVGTGLGVKPTFGFALPGLLVLAWLVRREPAPPRPGRACAAGLALLAVGLGSYWYVRNAALYGNPIHPGGRSGFVLPNGKVVQQVGPSLLTLKENLRRTIDSRVYDFHLGYNPTCEMGANWGPAVFALGLPALLPALRGNRRFRILTFAMAVSLLAVYSLVLSDRWFTRFALFVPAILCIAAADLAARIRAVNLLAAAALGLQFVNTLAGDRMSVDDYSAIYRQPWRERRAPMLGTGFPEREPAIASLQGGGLFIYLLYGPGFDRRVVYIRESEPEAVVAAMRRQGVAVVYGSREANAVLKRGVERGILKQDVGNFFSLPEWKEPSPTPSPSGRP